MAILIGLVDIQKTVLGFGQTLLNWIILTTTLQIRVNVSTKVLVITLLDGQLSYVQAITIILASCSGKIEKAQLSTKVQLL